MSATRWWAALILLLAAAVTEYALPRTESWAPHPPLQNLPLAFADWRAQDIPIDAHLVAASRADDYLNRLYRQAPGNEVGLYIGYYKSQRAGDSVHSPKNCLPGSGWEPVDVSISSLRVPGSDAPLPVNRYVVQHGDEKSVTFYWYQSPRRVIATEYAAKFWLVADSIRYRRSDTSLVRVIVPVQDNNVAAASDTGEAFIRALYPQLVTRLFAPGAAGAR